MKSLTSIAYKILTAFMIVMLALTAVPVSPVSAATSVLVPWGNAYNQASGTGNTHNLAIPAGANRMLVVGISTSSLNSENNNNPTTVSYGGVALTPAAGNGGTDGRMHTWLYYLKDNAVMDGTNRPLNVTVGGTFLNMTVWRAVYAGVDQSLATYTTGNGFNNNTSSGPAQLSAAMAVNAGDQAVYISNIYNANNSTTVPTYTINANWTTGGNTQWQNNPGGTNDDRAARIEVANRTVPVGNVADNAVTSALVPANSERYAMSAMSLPAARIATTTGLTSSLNPSNFGNPVIFTATVTSGSGTPAGTVTFYDGANAIGGSVALNAGGVATVTTSTLTAGSHNITAVYSGNGTYSPSTSAILVQVVNQAPTITVNNATFTVNTNVGNFNAGDATGSPTPTFSLSAALPSGLTFNATTGIITGTPALGTVGTYNYTMTASNGVTPPATSPFTLTINKANQTITFNAPGNAGYHTTFTVTPTSNSGLPVTVSTTTPAVCTVTPHVPAPGYDVYMLVGTGTCTLVASQVGDANYNAAPNVTRNVAAVPAATTTIITSSVNPSVVGQNVIFTVRVLSSGVPVTGGTVTLTYCEYWVNACDTPTFTLGTQTLVGGIATFNISTLPLAISPFDTRIPDRVTARYNPVANYATSNDYVDQVVNSASTATTLTSSINPSFFGQAVTFTATVTVQSPGAGQVQGGTITFYDGVATLGSGIVNASGQVTLTVSNLARGSHNITAYFQGTDDFGTSTSPILIQIVRRDSDTALVTAPNPSVYGSSVTFTATVTDPSAAGTPTGTVSFYDDVPAPNTLLGTGTLVNGIATFNYNALIVGAHNVTAVYNGDTFYVASTSTVVVHTVTPVALTVTADPQTLTYGDADPIFTFQYGGFLLGDDAADVDVPPTCDAPTPHVNVGTYADIIVCSGGVDDNYTFTYVAGTLTVTQKTLTITADNQGKTYGFTLTFNGTEFTTSGLIFSDTVTGVMLTSAGTPAAAVNGSYPIVPSAAVGSGLSNYAINYVNGTLTINSNLLIITASDRVKTYGQTITFTGLEYTYFIPNGTPGGGTLLPGETITTVTLTSTGTPANAPVGTHPIVPSNVQGNLSNYFIIYNNGQLDVNQAALTFNPDSHTKTYGDTFTGYTGTFTGLFAFDNTITPVYDSAGAPATATVAAPGPTYPINVSFDDPDGRLSNYILTLDPAPAATLTILPRTLTVTPTNRSKVYGDALTVVDFAGTITGIQNGDNITATYDSPLGDPATAAVGTYDIEATLSDPNGMLSNYTLVSPVGTLTVTQRDLIVTSDSQTKIYGDDFYAFTGSIVGLQNSDNITLTYASLGSPATAAVGTYPINITIVDQVPARLGNYHVIPNVGTLVVQQRILEITPNNQTKIYGDTFIFTAADGVVTGLQNGDAITPVYSSPGAINTATVAGSTYPITVTLNDPGGKLVNYSYTLNSALLTVTLRDLVVTPNDQTKIYGQWFTNFTGVITGIQNGENISANYASTGSLPTAAVGTYPITSTLNDPTGKLVNYNVSQPDGTLTVTSLALTVRADNKTIAYGDPDPAFTFTYSGFMGTDTAAVIDTPPTCTVLVDPHTAIGTYPIICSGAADDNYSFVYVDGTLTITKRALVVTPTDKIKTYGNAFSAFTGTMTGVQAGDVITVAYDSLGAPATAAVGDYDITATLTAAAGVLDNYAVTLNMGTLSVIQRDLVVTPDNKTKLYGDLFTAFTGTVNGVQNSDPITVTYSSTGAPVTATVAGSTYPIIATLSAPAGVLANYNITLNQGSLTVNLRPLVVTPDNKAKVFGTVFPAASFTGVVTGIQAGDAITVAYDSTGAPAAAAVGTYPITVTLTDPGNKLPNYTVTLNQGTMTVGLSVLTITANPQTIIYGDPDPAFTFTYSGFVNGDTPAMVDIAPSCTVSGAHTNIGTYPIVCSGGVDANYAFSYVTSTLTITPRTLTVTPANKTKVYGDLFTAFTGTVVGLQGSDGITVSYDSLGAPASAAIGTYDITAALDDPNGRIGNYIVTLNMGTLTVTRRTLSVTPDDKSKVYGSLFTAFTGNVVGIQNSDPIVVTYASAGGPVTAAVGTYPIIPTITATPAILANYNIPAFTGTLTVTERDLVFTPADKTKIYGDVFAAYTGTITGIQNGDAITATYFSTGAVSTAPIGDYNITVTPNATPAVLANYNVTLNIGTLSVTPRTLTVTPDNKAKVFGTTFSAFTGVVTGLRVGDVITPVYASTGAPAVAAVGTYPITVTLTDPGNKLPNYTVTLNQGILTVGLSVLTIAGENKTITYGDLDPAFTFTYTGFVGSDTPAVIDTPPSCQVSVVHNNVGNYPIVCSGGMDDNYAFSYTPGILTVTPRALTVTPANKTKVYGDAFAAFTGTIVGIQSGDNISPNYASAGAPATADIGTYPITATLNDPGNRLGNYTVTLNTATLTVTQRPLTVTPNNASKIYGNVFNTFTGTIVGIQNSDAITATYTSTGSVATATVAGSPYPIVATLNAPAGVLANYNITNNTGNLTVTQRDLVVQPADKTKVYGTLFSAFTGSIVGIQNSDNITATYSSIGSPVPAAVGTYPITTTMLDPTNKLPNYNVSIGTATLTVSLANQTITITTPAPGNGANGSDFTVAATASSGLTVTYSTSTPLICTNVGATFTIVSPSGTCIVRYNQAGDANFNAAPEVTENVTALPNSQTITVTVPAPTVSAPGSVFDVAATASSGLTVSISASGVCNIIDHGDGTATITIVAPNGTCVLHYNQSGDATFASAPQITQSVTVDSTPPNVTINQATAQIDPTNVSPINFTAVFSEPVTGFVGTDVTLAGTAAATTAVVTEIAPNNGTKYNVAVSGMSNDGTVIASIPAGAITDIAGNDNFASSSTDNTVTYFDGNGPTVALINTNPDTGDAALTESEQVKKKLTHFMVKFNQDVNNPAGDSDPDDVTNPYNYMLIRDLGDTAGFQTVSCSAGPVTPADTSIAIGTVIYDSAASTATFTINGGLPLSNGTYRLFVCGTTSIVDPLDLTLGLVGVPGQPNSDFTRNFTVQITGGGGGGGGGDDDGGTTRVPSSALIPVTGFAPNKTTLLPAQPADKAYKSLDKIQIEIPTLGVDFPIVGVSLAGNNWNLTWLKNNVGYLEGSAYPTFNGNTVLTAHVLDSNNNLGPFSDIKGMNMNDKIYIHAYGKIYVYKVQENSKISPANISTVFKHQEYSWVTLVTCEEFDAKTGLYKYRRMVRAVLVSVVPEE